MLTKLLSAAVALALFAPIAGAQGMPSAHPVEPGEPVDPPDPCDPYWRSEAGPSGPCYDIKPPVTCLFGQMESRSSSDGIDASAHLDGSEAGPLCSVESQASCASSQSWNYIFEDPCGGNTPHAWVNGHSQGHATVDAEAPWCTSVENWILTYGVGRVTCTLWDAAQTCKCELTAGKDAESAWTHVITITVGEDTYDLSVPVTVSSSSVSGSCSKQAAGGGHEPMFTVTYETQLTISGHADGCLVDRSQVDGWSWLKNRAPVTLRWNIPQAQ